LIEMTSSTQTPPPVETTPVFGASEPVVASPPPTPAVSEPEPEIQEDEDEPEKVPFWRKAFSWNRAASTPIIPAEAISTPELIPEEAFDEGFLWSAEVLSAQGRRPQDVTVEEITWLKKLRKGLQRTSRGLVNDLKAVVGKGPISADDLDDIENLLLSADVGVASTERIIEALKVRVKKESLSAEAVFDFLKAQLKEQLEFDDPVGYAPKRGQLNVWLIVGVNGVGKTTTIGKIAHLAQQSGYKTLVAAGDTFRAAAVEQLQEWGRRSGVEVIANKGKNADPAAVVFDGIMAAQARGSELLLVDTAGRLQNKKNLMEELAKIRRIIDKKATGAHIEALLVLDASTGQNGLVQAKVFSEVANLSGVILTKLDGTARGGVALAVVEELKIPIRFIGVGEKINDLRPFNSYEFVEALLSDQS
jgi:fused signal recognition particle receptor